MEMQSQVNALLTMQGINLGAQMRISTNSPSDQTTGHSLSRRAMVSHSGQTCELQSMRGRVVAIGRMLGDREDAHENAYRIIVDEILEFNAELFGARGQTFGDIDVGSTIRWPKVFTNVI
ncbi:hypothetical protein IFM89_030558 [Coptis chinensis]|uniref:Uncharacterized protein n=1 Tax=Coptis chinensis TaxID=261450 RepID=A0A835HNE6_9MAGN|nr:hypothetical protein IFM89_030558 [Coptis chinensis]